MLRKAQYRRQRGDQGNRSIHIGTLNKIRYRGYYQDTETGLYYLMTRYYDPVTHRFLNADGYFQTAKKEYSDPCYQCL